MSERWSVEELELLSRYFTANTTLNSLFQRVLKLNRNRSFESMTRKLRYMREKGGYITSKEEAESKLRVGYLDIESTGLEGDWDMMLCWFIKVSGKNEYRSGVVRPEEMHKYELRDKRIVKELLAALDEFDVLYVHYGIDRRFDIPFIRTRALGHGLYKELRSLKETKFMRDTWLISRNKLRMSSNRLERLQDFLGVKNRKTRLKPHVWVRARMGYKDDIAYVADHCKADVVVLEEVHKRLEPVERKTYTGI